MWRHWTHRLACWLRLGHAWRYHENGDERRCRRCGLWQYAAVEFEGGERIWANE